ncbi:uncharacterized protein LOC100200699 isoform X3 [Hydra vulgaris]|uniref:Uncharacterized protein LOC100200699 isoform X3 n=1 Tax=Hydra vulgaris TaxID=6087 RepID=A0ABM4D5J8_HYDVU
MPEFNGEEFIELRKQHAKYFRIRRIQCLNGLFLEVLCDGEVRGTVHDSTKYGVFHLVTVVLYLGVYHLVTVVLYLGVFHLVTVGVNKLAIRSLMTGLFVANGVDNKVESKEDIDSTCVFEERFYENFCVAYISETSKKPCALTINSFGQTYLTDTGVTPILQKALTQSQSMEFEKPKPRLRRNASQVNEQLGLVSLKKYYEINATTCFKNDSLNAKFKRMCNSTKSNSLVNKKIQTESRIHDLTPNSLFKIITLSHNDNQLYLSIARSLDK